MTPRVVDEAKVLGPDENPELRRDRRLLITAGFLRAAVTSVVGISLGVHLSRIGIEGTEFGLVVSAGLLGAALAAIAATMFADRLGPRRFLVGLTLLGVLGTIAFSVSSAPLSLAAAAFVGMLNGMGRDRGAALIIEQAALPSTTTDAGRTRVIALYTMSQDLGHALGAILVSTWGWLQGSSEVHAGPGSHRVTFLACAGCSVVALFIYAGLGSALDRATAGHRPKLSARSRSLITHLSALFAVDSLAGGFLTTAMLSYFFFERFGATEGLIGALFFGARLMNALSHLGAAWLAKRIGLVNTMVFTHIPSSLLLLTVAFAPSLAVASVFFLLREGLVEMDVPTRQSYVLAVVDPAERTLASGITNLVRLAAWGVAPLLAGALMSEESLYLPLVIGATMKIVYDLLLWRAFRGVQPPEEVASPQ